MANTYIQNFIKVRQQQLNAPVTQNNANKGNAEVIVKPENPKGYIVKENVLQSIGSSATGLAKTGGYFIDAINGKGTDYSVGRINDGARFLGSLGIAGALASTAKNPKAKVMEFVGFSTWFASMSLWPKMLGTAIKATKGVDINQEYVDSYGRRKKFFEDAQYITWDLYKNKDLQKLGDKLGVPKNIENRNEAIKEKAKQVSVQGNTLMMLTAGFATPIASAIVCNGLENPVSKVIEKAQLLIANNNLKKLNQAGLMPGNEAGLEQLGKIIGPEQNVHLNIEQAKQVRNLYSQFKGTGIGLGTEKELEKLLGPSSHVVKDTPMIRKELQGTIFIKHETLKTIVGDESAHIKAVKNALRSIETPEFNELVQQAGKLNKQGQTALNGLVREALAEPLISLKGIKGKKLLNADQRETIYSTIEQQLNNEYKKHSVIEVSNEKLQNLFKIGHDFGVRKNIIDSYAKATIGNIADSQTANHWENAPIKILKALGMDKKTLKLIENDPLKAPERIFNHLVELAKNDEKFKKAVAEIAEVADKVVEKESKAAEKLTAAWEKTEKDIKENLKKLVLEEKTAIKNSIKDNAKKSEDRSAAVKPMQELRKARNSQRKAFEVAIKDAINLEKTDIENKLMNTKSSFYRPLLVLERTKEKIKDIVPLLKEINEFKTDDTKKIELAKSKKALKELTKDVKELISGYGIDFWSNKGEHLGINDSTAFGQFVDKTFAPIKNILKQKEGDNTEKIKALNALKNKIDSFYQAIKSPLSKIDGANRNFIGDSTKNRNDWAVRVGKNLEGFIRDAAIAQKIKDTWLKSRVLPIAGAVVAVSGIAISQFGKKNKYNPDVYAEKGKK